MVSSLAGSCFASFERRESFSLLIKEISYFFLKSGYFVNSELELAIVDERDTVKGSVEWE